MRLKKIISAIAQTMIPGSASPETKPVVTVSLLATVVILGFSPTAGA